MTNHWQTVCLWQTRATKCINHWQTAGIQIQHVWSCSVLIIYREAREIIRLVASVRLSVCLSVCLHGIQSKISVCVLVIRKRSRSKAAHSGWGLLIYMLRGYTQYGCFQISIFKVCYYTFWPRCQSPGIIECTSWSVGKRVACQGDGVSSKPVATALTRHGPCNP